MIWPAPTEPNHSYRPMTIVKIRLERYKIGWKHLVGLADECIGAQLCVSANAEEVEFGFDKAENATFFRNILETCFKRPEPKPPAKKKGDIDPPTFE